MTLFAASVSLLLIFASISFYIVFKENVRIRETDERLQRAMIEYIRMFHINQTPSTSKIINVDFTEANLEHDEPWAPVRDARYGIDEEKPPSRLKYKLVYDSELGIYCKVPR